MGTLTGRYRVIVPIHNGQMNVFPLIHALQRIPDTPAELILVDDGSSDESWHAIKKAAENQESGFRIRGLRLDRNRGQQSALLAGLICCGGLSVITMDDDLAHPFSIIPEMLAAIDSGSDLVYARPPVRPGGRFRGIASTLHQIHMNIITGSPMSVRVGSYRVMSSALVKRLMSAPPAWPYLSAMALSLRPRPNTAMIKSGFWQNAAVGRFSLPKLIKLEIYLALYHGPAARLIRRWKKSAGRTNRDIAHFWIIERTSP